MDEDGSQKVSRDEWISKYGSAEGFEQFDHDGDGTIDMDEFRKARTAQKRSQTNDFRYIPISLKAFDQIDKDGDGRLSKEELLRAFPNEADKISAGCDFDRDGFCSHQEWCKFVYE